MIFNELPIAFPWYDKIEKQNRYTEHVDIICDYKLLNPRNGLLPFQFYKSVPANAMPNRWEIREINTNNLVHDMTFEIPNHINRAVKDGKEYFTYYGGTIGGVNLPTGYFYSYLQWADNTRFYSEMFYVPQTTDVFVTETAGNPYGLKYIRLSWYNNNDLKPIFYNDKGVDLKPKFKQVVYLDTFIHASEPELVEDGKRDGNDETIPTFQKMVINYRISILAPDFLKKALALIPMHDVAEIITQNGVRQGQLRKVKVNTALEAGGALSVVDILFQEELMVKKGCGENMV